MNLLQIECRRARREGSGVGVIMVDLDHFKNTNDTYGHPVGDEILRAVAHRHRTALRQYDHVGSYGGEELLVVAG